MEYFGLKLQTLRKKTSMSQAELADLVGVSRQAISKWERAEALPDLYNAKKIAEVFNITLDDLMDIEIKSIGKTKQKTNKTALAFLFVPGVLGILGILSGIFSLFFGGGILTSTFVLGLFLSIYGVLYSIILYHLYIGKNTSKYRVITIGLNYILLIGYIVLLINSLGESGAGYILLFILFLAIIVLGIIGGHLFNPILQEDHSGMYIKKHKAFITSFKIIVIILIARYLVLLFYFVIPR